jgi:translocation and assembly module TamB
MRRTSIILAAFALALVAMLAAAWLALFETSPGRRFIASLIERELGDAFGGEARIGALEGRPPGDFTLVDIEITDGEGVWLKAGKLAVEWRPAALLSGKISINEAELAGVDLIRKPAPSRDKPEKPEIRGAIRLPGDLPNISIRKLSLTDIRISERIAGRVLVVAGAGALRVEGGLLMLKLAANSGASGDFIDAAINIDPGADHGYVDVVVSSDADGALSSLLELGGPAFVEVRGEAPLSAFEAGLVGDIGGYGAIDAILTSDLVSAESLSIEAALQFGEKLAALSRDIGPALSLDGEIRQAEAEISIAFSKLEAEAGAASGSLSWSNRGDVIGAARADFEIAFSATHFEELQRLLGSTASLSADASLQQRDYRLEARLASPLMTGLLSEARSDLRSSVAGRLAVEAAPNEALPTPLKRGASLAGDVTIAGPLGISFSALDITLPDGSTLSGAGAYGGEARAMSFTGDLSVSPAFVEARVPSLHPAGPLLARVVAAGASDDFTVNLDAESAEAAINGAVIPAAEIAARLAGLPHALNAALSATPIDSKGSLTLLFKLGEAGSFSIPRLEVEAPAFKLSGSGAWNDVDERAAIDLAYSGGDGAQPYPGLTLSGVLAAKGEIGRGTGASNLRITGENLVSDDFAVGALDLAASGPADRIAFTLAATNLTAPVAGFFDKIDADGRLALAGEPEIRIERFTALHAGAPVSLAAPATFVFGDGIDVRNLRVAYGAEGALSLDGEFSPQRWRADFAAKNLSLAAANSVIDFELALDTDKPRPARGEFLLRSLFATGETPEIAGAIDWDGARLRLTEASAASPLTFDIDTPLALVRSPNLSVTSEGSIHGEAAYKDDLQTLTAFLPSPLQTLDGDVEATAQINGDLNRPAIEGRVAIRDGAYTELVSGLTLTGLHLDAAANATAAGSAIDFSAGARGPGQDKDTVKLAGRIDITDAATIDAGLTLERAAFAAGPVNRAMASGEVRLSGPLAAMAAAGTLNLIELNADIIDPPSGGLVDIEVVTPDDRADAPKPANLANRAPPLSLAVKIEADDRVFIRGRGLDSEWRANIDATGDAESPLLVGALTLRRGTLDFSGRRFTFSRGEIVFDRLSANDPALDLRAEYATRDGVTAAIEVSGRASAPSVSLVSSPSLPPEDIMALILFGKPARELSALESLQVAQALAQLSGVGPFGKGGGVTGIARRTLGLDLLNISVDSDAGASSLEVGKYVAEGLFVSVKEDARGEKGSVRVEYEITGSISIETEMRQDGEQTVSANWKHDF